MPRKPKVKTQPLSEDEREMVDDLLLDQGWLPGWITNSVRITVLQDLKSKKRPTKTNGPTG